MSKELEALNGLFDLIHCQESFEKAQKYFDIIEEALKRLEAIDNANPSEALECVDKILGYFGKAQIETMTLSKCNVLTIKQALLKTQEFNEILEKYYVDDLDELNTILTNYRKHYR